MADWQIQLFLLSTLSLYLIFSHAGNTRKGYWHIANSPIAVCGIACTVV